MPVERWQIRIVGPLSLLSLSLCCFRMTGVCGVSALFAGRYAENIGNEKPLGIVVQAVSGICGSRAVLVRL
jgi:hypothetical protein